MKFPAPLIGKQLLHSAFVIFAAVYMLVGCGGGGGGGAATQPATFTLGGAISGLTATGLVLANGTATVSPLASGTTFSFSQSVAAGVSYSVSVQTQPPGLNCSVTSASGVMGTADVSNVVVACTSIGPQETILFSFPSIYGSPYAGVIQGSDGNFYGTAKYGGVYGAGMVYKITSAGVETVLHSFGTPNSSDGIFPQSALIQGSDGNFYGTTTFVGSSAGGVGKGVVYKITPAGVETMLNGIGAGNGSASVIQGSDGNFYGTTAAGGGYNSETFYVVTPAGVRTELYYFGSSGVNDGRSINAGVTQASDGNFYGTTVGGGAGGGTFYKVTPAGVETVLYSFGTGGSNDGYFPQSAVIQGSDGDFYGTTEQGGANGTGTVYRVTAAGIETVLHSFGSASSGDGLGPVAGVIQGSDGNFYGTTIRGGTNNKGTVYKFTPAGVETVLYSFGATGSGDGDMPLGGVIQGRDGNFYGTTVGGGANGYGTVFKIVP